MGQHMGMLVLIAYVQVPPDVCRGVRGLITGLSLCLLPNTVCTLCQGFGKTVHMQRLI